MRRRTLGASASTQTDSPISRCRPLTTDDSYPQNGRFADLGPVSGMSSLNWTGDESRLILGSIREYRSQKVGKLDFAP